MPIRTAVGAYAETGDCNTKAEQKHAASETIRIISSRHDALIKLRRAASLTQTCWPNREVMPCPLGSRSWCVSGLNSGIVKLTFLTRSRNFGSPTRHARAIHLH